jgi:type IV pilus assembly protein PilB
MISSLLDILEKEKLISIDDKKKYLKKKVNIFKEITETEKIEPEILLKTISKHISAPFDLLDRATLDIKITQLIPETFSRKHHIIALFKLGNTMSIGCSNPLDTILIEELEIITKCTISIAISTQEKIDDLINYAYSYQEQRLESDGSSMSSLFEMGLELMDDKAGGDDEVTDMAQEAPIAKLVDTIITQAINEKASDIHIEPDENAVKIRFRVDGLLKEVMSPPKKLASPIVSRLKILSDMDITETRKPQDGRLTFKLKDRDIDFRVSSVRTISGEKMVLRMLDKSDSFVSMEKIGLSEHCYTKLDSLIQSTSGIIVVCGPTGSGKTSSLYSCLSKINTPERNIITIEDPVEFNLEGINQIPINPKIGVDFVTGLSTVVRQDPDVIMIGEIRDIETANVAIQAALTGHLVFSTLHTRSASGSVTRLINMGVQPFLINSAFLGVVGQRLCRQICKSCKRQTDKDQVTNIKEKAILDMLIKKNPEVKIFKGAGCKYCNETGYKGRIGIFEILTLNAETSELIIQKSSSEKIKEAAVKNGMVDMLNDGIDKITQGITSIEEIARVLDV